MALTTTTASAAIAATDQSITVASATSFSAGLVVKVNAEFMQVRKDYVSGTTIPVLRGVGGTFPAAHGITSNVVFGAASDFATGAPQATLEYPYIRVRQTKAYGASGAITLPTPGNDMVAILNGTSVLSMSVAAPTKDQDGDLLWIIGNGAAAHVITYTGGLSGAGSSYDVLTVNATKPLATCAMACNGVWTAVVQVPMAGTVTNITGTLT